MQNILAIFYLFFMHSSTFELTHLAESFIQTAC